MNQQPSFPRKMPIGIQSFEKLRRENYVYIDKTEIMYRLVSTSNPYFLSRPRRFGKSLMLSTMEAYFLGKRDLFKGLAIERLETEWNTHAVLHLDLNAEKYDSPERLHDMLERQLRGWEKTYETGGEGITHSGRFMEVIKKAYEKTGRGVVILIDEYDKPLLNSFHDEALQKAFRETLTAFYTVLKSADQWLRFVFITGVTKFAQMGIFSNLNQLKDISLDPRYAALCGLTGDEIRADFVPELKLLAKENNLDDEACMERLTRMYDGYHFNYRNMVGIYNPFSILNVLDSTMFENYWFASGTPTFLAEMLKKTDFDLRELDGIEVSAASLSDDRANINNPVPMIYQSGYLTIKKYDERFQIYTLGFPNDEVKYGFLNFVTPFYTPVAESETSFYIGKFIHELESGDVDAFLTRLRAFFAGISYELNNRTERHYQTIFYLVFKLMGQFSETEVRSAKGRADAVVKTADYIYVFEFKLDGSADQALAQINDRGYLIPYTVDGRKLVKIGVNFDPAQRNIGDWKREDKN
ncbi:ATP-binding protein [Butyricimonas sp.]|uniref:ATP-binding protein n=1 Tax=Butyricimonas sp. TaxID=1969738 RepID=UPI0025880AE3|nr:ATP-binding protein [Butyricimonas sp.]